MPPVLDRIPRFDEQSRRYPAVRAIRRQSEELSNVVWTPGSILDQGEEGACVGFGWSAELEAEPVPVSGITNMYAQNLYSEAVHIDESEGNYYNGEGASVLAGAKACANRGLIPEYRWAFGIHEVLQSLIHLGPVVLGLNWYSAMYETTQEGIVQVGGDLVGGHCILAMGVAADRGLVYWQNSWGDEYGVGGIGGIQIEDLDTLLQQEGEACVPMTRAYGPEPHVAEEPPGPQAPAPAADDKPFGCLIPFGRRR